MANNLKKSGKSAKCAWQFNEEQDVPGHIVPLGPRIMDRDSVSRCTQCIKKGAMFLFVFWIGREDREDSFQSLPNNNVNNTGFCHIIIAMIFRCNKNWYWWWWCNLCNLDFHKWRFSAIDLWIHCNHGFQMSMFQKSKSPWCLQTSKPWFRNRYA